MKSSFNISRFQNLLKFINEREKYIERKIILNNIYMYVSMLFLIDIPMSDCPDVCLFVRMKI